MKYIPLDEVEKILKQMISDANSSMYPEWKVLEMKEFNIFSCWKASIEIAKDRIQSLKTIDLSIIDEMIEETIKYWISTDHKQYNRVLWRKIALKELKERLSLNK